MDILRHQLEPTLRKLEHTSGQVLCRKSAPDKWSAFQHLCHLARMHEVYADRVSQALNEDDPDLVWYDSATDPKWQPLLENMTVPELPHRLRTLRNALVIDLEDISPDMWGRPVFHQRYGSMPLCKTLEHFLLHEAHHLYVVFQLIHMKEPLPHG